MFGAASRGGGGGGTKKRRGEHEQKQDAEESNRRGWDGVRQRVGMEEGGGGEDQSQDAEGETWGTERGGSEKK